MKSNQVVLKVTGNETKAIKMPLKREESSITAFINSNNDIISSTPLHIRFKWMYY